MFDKYLDTHDLYKELDLPFSFPFPTCTDREGWEQIPGQSRGAMIFHGLFIYL